MIQSQPSALLHEVAALKTSPMNLQKTLRIGIPMLLPLHRTMIPISYKHDKKNPPIKKRKNFPNNGQVRGNFL
jgi:hypothetical protein